MTSPIGRNPTGNENSVKSLTKTKPNSSLVSHISQTTAVNPITGRVCKTSPKSSVVQMVIALAVFLLGALFVNDGFCKASIPTAGMGIGLMFGGTVVACS